MLLLLTRHRTLNLEWCQSPEFGTPDPPPQPDPLNFYADYFITSVFHSLKGSIPTEPGELRFLKSNGAHKYTDLIGPFDYTSF